MEIAWQIKICAEYWDTVPRPNQVVRNLAVGLSLGFREVGFGLGPGILHLP